MSLSLKTHQLFQPFSEPHIVSPAVQGLLPLDEQWAEWREANQDLVLKYSGVNQDHIAS